MILWRFFFPNLFIEQVHHLSWLRAGQIMESDLPHVFINKVLLAHGHGHSHINADTTEPSSHKETGRPPNPQIFTISSPFRKFEKPRFKSQNPFYKVS